MRVDFCCVVVHMVVCAAIAVQFSTPDQYITEAYRLQGNGQLEQAISLMDEAVTEFPMSSDVYTHAGILLLIRAGQENSKQVFSTALRAFHMWNRAIELNSDNILARYYRGYYGVTEAFGYLDEAIDDLDYLSTLFEQTTDVVSSDSLSLIYNLLGTGYMKIGEYAEARQAFERAMEIAPGTGNAKTASDNLDLIVAMEQERSLIEKEIEPDSSEIAALKAQLRKDPSNQLLRLNLSKAYYQSGKVEKAVKLLKQLVRVDPSNIEAHKWLARSLLGVAAKGYDIRTYIDQGFRSNLCFEAVRELNRTVELAPNDLEMRMIRGRAGVDLPFFVGMLDQAMEDLKMVVNSSAPDAVRANALYWLGAAHQRKAISNWNEVVSKYPSTEAYREVIKAINPPVQHFDVSGSKRSLVLIDFVLGFKDELAPQTAIWIEDKDGKFIRTIYISGFSGFAKEKQVNLPDWAKSSKFADVDAVTGASINLGEHIYTWDLKDTAGSQVAPGEYEVKVEVAYWPSHEYQMNTARIGIGNDPDRVLVTTGDLIPYLEVRYNP